MSVLHTNSLPPTVSAALSSAAVSANLAQNASPANRAGLGDTIGLAEFHENANVKPHTTRYNHQVSLLQRLVQTRAGRVPVRRTNDALVADVADASLHLHAASSDLLGALHSGGRSGVEGNLVETYDPLERHALLQYARCKVDESDFSQPEKDRLKNDLDGMLGELMDTHGADVRAGLKHQGAFESTLEELHALSAARAGSHAGSLSELRAQFGSRSNGKLEAALTPMALAQSLFLQFGNDFSVAMRALRTKMTAQLRTRPDVRPGPRMMMSFNDAFAFNTVQSAFAQAGELRHGISEHAKVVAKGSQAETALALLGVTEQGRGRAEPLLGQVADSKTMTPMQQMYLFRLTGQAVEKMPMTAWPKDVPAQRANLLAELRTLSVAACDKMPRTPTLAARLEDKMRAVVQSKDPRGQRDQPQSDHQRREG